MIKRSRLQQLNNKQGSALMIVLLVLVVVSIFGMSLLSVSLSNYKLTYIERDFQSVYYIAEAGVREAIHEIESKILAIYNSSQGDNPDSFFAAIVSELNGKSYTYEESFGHIPVATISLQQSSVVGNQRTYLIKSKGDIGDRTRTVSSEIRIEWVPKSTSTLLPTVFTLGNGFTFTGNTINGAGSSAIVNGNLTPANLNGGSFNGVSNVYVSGSLHFGGSTTFGSPIQPGVIVVQENYRMQSNSTVNGDVYVGKNYTHDNNARFRGELHIKENATINNVGTFDKNMYVGRDYELNNTLTHDGKLYVHGNGRVTNRGTFNDDIHFGGNFESTNTATYRGNVYVNGNANLQEGNFYKDVYVTGNATVSSNVKLFSGAQVRQASTPTIPAVTTMTIPQYELKLRTDETHIQSGRLMYTWYQQNGYTQYDSNLTLNQIPNNFKAIIEGSFSSSHHTSPSGNIVIISKEGNINIGNWRHISGVLIAPKGSINLNGIASFTGVAISRDGVFMNAGGSTLTSRDLSYYFDETTVPIIINGLGGSVSNVSSPDELLIQYNYNAIREE
ncbi:hypothetical protein [Serpentinicella alkaliphila]|uniref:PilX-like prepilin protein n=1 Tax=Serpentinicella alkaliphila TaxID=1734049 RepID=A0A4V2T3B9_9FIRM|nr:hypothetical protein [Serpentinicella alkaliphila]QUH26659.1 hypothetical protein HZR23_13630 [Serpentinicella alkaliphila]TCQ00544.1 hypothetical protein EDD79_103033 [Serpentinicella alkaliphila]